MLSPVTPVEQQELLERFHGYQGIVLDVYEQRHEDGQTELFQPGDHVLFRLRSTNEWCDGVIGLLLDMVDPGTEQRGVYAVILVGDRPNQRTTYRRLISDIHQAV